MSVTDAVHAMFNR